MNKVYCSTGAFIGRRNDRNHRLIREYADLIDCDGFEFLMFNSWYDRVGEVVRDLRGMSDKFHVMHCAKNIGSILSSHDGDISTAFEKFKVNCEVAAAFDIDKMVVHLWDGIISDNYIDDNIRNYARIDDIAKTYGIQLLVENVVCNKEQPMTHWKKLSEIYEDIAFVFDTKMAAFHGQLDLVYSDEWKWLWEGNHIRHLHINDYAGAYMDWDNLKTLPVGRGNVDFDTFFSFINKIGYQYDFTVEGTAINPDGSADYDELSRCVGVIRQRIE